LRADAKDIPKMFQILYSMEGESKSSEEKNEEKNDQEVADVSGNFAGFFFYFHYFRCNYNLYD